MKNAFTHLASFFGFVLSIFIPFSIMIAMIQITTARDFHSVVIDRIQSSYYSQTVIDSCIEKANEHDYILEVKDMTIYQDRKDILVNLSYDIVLPLFNIHITQEIPGYAR